MKRLVFILFALLFSLSACTQSKPPLEKALLGAWKNADGFEIHFSDNGEGFIPGVPGQIHDTSFTYTIVDESHISLDLQGQEFPVEIKIDDDTLNWKDNLGEVIYQRVK